jgi:hypothetical protein
MTNGDVKKMYGADIYGLYLEHGLQIDDHFVEYEKDYNLGLMREATHIGDLEAVKTIYDENNFSRQFFNLVEIAIENNHVDIVKYLVEEKKELMPENLTRLCKKEHVEMCEYIESNYCIIRPKASFIECIEAGNLKLLKYLVEDENQMIKSSSPLMRALCHNRRNTENAGQILRYVLDKSIEHKVMVDGHDAITLEDSYPSVFDEMFEHGLVEKFGVDVEVNFDSSSWTDKEDLDIKYLDISKSNLKYAIKNYCSDTTDYIHIIRLWCDIASMSVEFEYNDSTICENVEFDFNGKTESVLQTTHPNLFESNFETSLHTYKLICTMISLKVKTASKNFKSIKINIKFDVPEETHAASFKRLAEKYKLTDVPTSNPNSTTTRIETEDGFKATIFTPKFLTS